MGHVSASPFPRRRRRVALAAVAATGVLAAAWTLRELPAAMGNRADGARLNRMRQSPQYADGVFSNPSDVAVEAPDPTLVAREWRNSGPRRKPTAAIPVSDPHTAPASTIPSTTALRLLWYGHASSLVEIDGVRLLLDPVWSQRCSPLQGVGPRRLHRVPSRLEQLPPVDAVLISHDHYDHLDMRTVKRLVRLQSAPFVVPLGVGAHLDRWKVPPERIVELDWEEQFCIGDVVATLTAAQHFSGRGLSRNATLWGSWALAGPRRRVFYSGDSGYFDGFAAIGREHGPFDATLMQVGAFSSAWPHIHMTPAQALRAHLDVAGGLLLPVHWCTFGLAFHDWSRPAEELAEAAAAHQVALATPHPGDVVDVDAPPPTRRWWREVA